MTSGELHVLLPRGLKSALRSMVGFLNTFFELLQFIEIIYITNKCNQQTICLSFIPLVRLFMRNIQTAVSPRTLKIGHMLYELIYSEQFMLPLPKIFTIPPGTSCIFLMYWTTVSFSVFTRLMTYRRRVRGYKENIVISLVFAFSQTTAFCPSSEQ